MSGTGTPGTLFIDAGGVLVDPDWERVAGILAGLGIAASPAALAAAEPAAKRAIDVPPAAATDDRRRGVQFFREILRAAGLGAGEGPLEAADLALRAEHEARNLWTVIPPGAPEALDRLRAAGVGLVLVSNAGADLPGLFGELGLARRLDHIVVSALVGVEKPHPGIFLEALRVSGASADATVHVGDLYEVDVLGARAAGIRGVLVDPAGARAGLDCERFPSFAAYAGSLLRRR